VGYGRSAITNRSLYDIAVCPVCESLGANGRQAKAVVIVGLQLQILGSLNLHFYAGIDATAANLYLTASNEKGR